MLDPLLLYRPSTATLRRCSLPLVDAPGPFPLPHDPPLPDGTLGLGLPHELLFWGEFEITAFARLHARLVELTLASDNALTPEERNVC
jgi:hypothetical protein